MAGNQQKRNLKQEINQSLEELSQIYKEYSYFTYAYRNRELYSKLHEFRSTLGDLLNATKSEEYNKEFVKLTEEEYGEYNRLLRQLIERIKKGKNDSIISNYARSEERKNPVRPSHKLSMTEAGLPDVGPCTFRALLGIAETKAGKYLTADEIKETANWAFANGKMVTSGENKWYVNYPTGDIITKGLSVLGITKGARWIVRKEGLALNDLPSDAEASLIKTNKNLYGYVHFAEGNEKGQLIFDPVGHNTFSGKDPDGNDIKVTQIDYFKF
jgi:hypothetical protein